MIQNGYFITGTDTGIGKTVVSTVLAHGLGASFWKPVQTGSSEGTDRNFVERWLGERTWPESYIFPEPASPHMAASLAGQRIDIQKIKSDLLNITDDVLIEGAGGALVPINESFLMVDLISIVSLPAIVVTSTRLGTINHTLLTLEALHRRSINAFGFITVGEESPVIVRTLEHFSGSRSLGHIPACPAFSLNWFKNAFQHLDVPQFSKEEQNVLRS